MKSCCTGIVAAWLLLIAAQAGTAAEVGSANVVRASIDQVTNGWSIGATHDIDQVIRFKDDRIANVWVSNLQMWTPRFSKGGRILMLQANADENGRKLLPQ
ncbi:MAG: hypothetical protein H7Y22_13470, partial [Gemmatimonadaceae bacterium]|nr:hypothetical protein [Gloeobacterales cyanobacterium ES-bin-141]